jgi:hypothetical protein
VTKKSTQPTTPPSEYYLKISRQFLANCIGYGDRRPSMKVQMFPQYLPNTKIERRLWDAIIWYWNRGEAATREAMIGAMESYADMAGQGETAIDFIQSHATEDRDVTSFAHQILHWYERQRMIDVADKHAQQARDPGTLNNYDLVENWQRDIAMINPRMTQVLNVRVGEETQKILESQQDRRYERFLKGMAASPQMPYMKMRSHIFGLREGDPLLWTIQTKGGKSTQSQVLGEYWFGEGYYVVSVENETSVEVFEQRRLAHYLGVPTWAWRTTFDHRGRKMPPIARRAPEWHKLFQHYDDLIATHAKRGGILSRVNGADMPIDIVSAQLSTHKQIADSLGMEMIVLVDYLQATGKQGIKAKDEREALAQIATAYKHMIQNLKCYGVVFAQETITGNGEVIPFGSAEAKRRFQVHITTCRAVARDDQPVIAPGGTHAKDAFGNKRYYHRNDGKSMDSNAVIEVLIANDDRPGTCDVVYENGLFRITEKGTAPIMFEYLLPE